MWDLQKLGSGKKYWEILYLQLKYVRFFLPMVCPRNLVKMSLLRLWEPEYKPNVILCN